MTRHPTSVVNNSRYVAADNEGKKNYILNFIRAVQHVRKAEVFLYNSLSIGLQLTDFKEDHEVIFGVTGSSSRASQSVELCGWH